MDQPTWVSFWYKPAVFVPLDQPIVYRQASVPLSTITVIRVTDAGYTILEANEIVYYVKYDYTELMTTLRAGVYDLIEDEEQSDTPYIDAFAPRYRADTSKDADPQVQPTKRWRLMEMQAET